MQTPNRGNNIYEEITKKNRLKNINPDIPQGHNYGLMLRSIRRPNCVHQPPVVYKMILTCISHRRNIKIDNVNIDKLNKETALELKWLNDCDPQDNS